MFEPTIPFGEPELMRISSFQRYLDDIIKATGVVGSATLLTSLTPSLMEDLRRFEERGAVSEALEVLAACVRHSQRVTVHLQFDDKVVPLTVFPQERLLHCPIDVAKLPGAQLASLRVLLVEPSHLRPPGDPDIEVVAPAQQHHPLGTTMWLLALRGARSELLPEIAGPAAYRVAPGLDLGGLPVNAVLLDAVARLRRQAVNLREICDWPGMNRERAVRLLNALYLQSGLIVSRTNQHAAAAESWFAALGR